MKNILSTSLVLLGAISMGSADISSPLASEDCKILSPLYKKWLDKELDEFCCSEATIHCTLGKIIEIDLQGRFIETDLTVEDIAILNKLNLDKLELNNNLFYGKIPAEINTLNIGEVDLKSNFFSGEYPYINPSNNICLEDNYLTIPSNMTVNNASNCDNKKQDNPVVLKDGIYPSSIAEAVGKLSLTFICVLIIVPILIIIICCICCCCYCKQGKKKFRPYKGKMKPSPYDEANTDYSTPAVRYPPTLPAEDYPPPAYQLYSPQTEYPPQAQYPLQTPYPPPPPQAQYPTQAPYPAQIQTSYSPTPSANKPSAPDVPPLNLAGDITDNNLPLKE